MLRRSLGQSADLEDLTQEVFLVVFRKLQGLRNPTSLKAFIIAVTAHTSLEQRRRRWAQQQKPPLQPPPTDRELVARAGEARIALSRFVGALARLRPADRTVTMLRLVEQRELTDIASTLDVSLATVKRRIARGSAKVALLASRDPFLAQYSQAEPAGPVPGLPDATLPRFPDKSVRARSI
jgi:RNA polymerase sigma-70 factor (ECF subfamily)